ncbi:MAG: CPBP family intramembrane metalloprotease [Polyangiaceae bacterium]|nr:CPBP family intramembrane metalloprotease [Polyangiaceae bacterium]
MTEPATAPRPLPPALAVGWGFGATAGLVLSAQILASMRGAVPDLVSLGLVEGIVLFVTSALVLRLHQGERELAPALGLRATHPGLVPLALALGVVLHAPAEWLYERIERLWPTPADDLAAKAALLAADGPVRQVALVLVVACGIPVVEEIFYRGALFGAVRRGAGALSASLATGAAFVLGHFDLRTWAPLALVAAALSLVRASGGSLLPCVALHVGFNATTVGALLLGLSAPASPASLGAGATLAGTALTVALGWGIVAIGRRSAVAAAARAADD